MFLHHPTGHYLKRPADRLWQLATAHECRSEGVGMGKMLTLAIGLPEPQHLFAVGTEGILPTAGICEYIPCNAVTATSEGLLEICVARCLWARDCGGAGVIMRHIPSHQLGTREPTLL